MHQGPQNLHNCPQPLLIVRQEFQETCIFYSSLFEAQSQLEIQVVVCWEDVWFLVLHMWLL